MDSLVQALQPPHFANRHDADCGGVGDNRRGAVECENAQVSANRRDRAEPDGLRAVRCAVGAELLVVGYR